MIPQVDVEQVILVDWLVVKRCYGIGLLVLCPGPGGGQPSTRGRGQDVVRGLVYKKESTVDYGRSLGGVVGIKGVELSVVVV